MSRNFAEYGKERDNRNVRNNTVNEKKERKVDCGFGNT